MQAGVSMSGFTLDGNYTARLMGAPDDCLQLDVPYSRWCLLKWPHDGDHQYNRERADPLSHPGQY